jgi:predicted lipoprotein with Yx(FWY)xxD motif
MAPQQLAEISMRLSSTVLLVLALASPATFAAPPAQVVDGALVGPSGMSLYTFDKDAGGKSACNGPCATNWPPLAAAADAKPEGDWTVITRDDGSRQWAYKGKPVYHWVKDTKPGDRSGDGFNQVWHLARP